MQYSFLKLRHFGTCQTCLVSEVLIAFGSNLGDRLGQIQTAINALSGPIRWHDVSRVYGTSPMYVADQPTFLNAAARGESDLDPIALLALLKQTERDLGRKPGLRFGPREIDLDLIDMRGVAMETEQLVLPHPRVSERRFVLVPIYDVAPNWQFAGFSIPELLKQTEDQAESVLEVRDAVLLLPSHE